MTVRHEPLTATWEVKVGGWQASSSAATAEWGTSRIHRLRAGPAGLQRRRPGGLRRGRARRRLHHPGPQRPRDDARRGQAPGPQRAVREWLWEDPERTDRLVAVYNRRYNATVLRRFDGSHLTFPGLAEWFRPYGSQRDIAYRIAATPAALCGFAVGGGKTAAMFLSALTLRRLGLATKPLIACPNHLLEQIARDGKRLFPGANILMVAKDDLTRERRKRFAARCATGDWDVVVITHSAFTALAVHPDTEAAWLATQIELYRQAAMALGEDEHRPSRTVKQIAKQADRLEARQRELLDHRTDDGVTFEQLGVDYLLVDEAHYFKRLGFPTRMEGFSVEASKRATDLALKLWWLRGRNPAGRCGAFFTGTPISNILAELYVLLTYLMPGRLAELGIDSFDAFAGMFIEFKTQIEVAPDGGSFRLHRRPANFTNVPELRTLLGEVADIRTRDTLGLATPDAEFDTVVVPASPELRAFVATLVERADAIRAGGVDRHDDNMLAVCNDGRRAALDLELVGIASDDPGKVGAVVERVAAIWRETAENRYPARTATLARARRAAGRLLRPGHAQPQRRAAGLRQAAPRPGRRRDPADRVRWVHEARTDAAKAALFADCRAGRVAVLLGSTDKLGVGTNIQDRCVAIHHVDAPWRPADVEQREGRGLRPATTTGACGSSGMSPRAPSTATCGRPWSARRGSSPRSSPASCRPARSRTSTPPPCPTPRSRRWPPASRCCWRRPRSPPRSPGCATCRAATSAPSAASARTSTSSSATPIAARSAPGRWRPSPNTPSGATRCSPPTVAGRWPTVAPSPRRWLVPRPRRCSRAPASTWASGAGSASRSPPPRPGRASSLEVTVRVAYRHAASFEFPKSWLQQGQQWRILAGLEQLVQGAPSRAAELRAAAAAARSRATDSQALLGRPFEHADQLAAALARQQQLEAAMRDQATAEGPSPPPKAR